MKVAILIAVIIIVASCVTVFLTRRGKSAAGPRDGYVDVYDSQTRQISAIPAAELATGMIRVKLDTGGVVWTKASDISQGPIRHPPFEGELRDIVVRIQKSLEEVYPHTYEFWEDGFRRDANAERELAVWLHLSRIYGEFVASKSTRLAERKEAFKVLVACSSGTKETALQTVQLVSLDLSDAESLVAKFFPSRTK